MNKLCIVSDCAEAAADISGQLTGLFAPQHIRSQDVPNTDAGRYIIIDVDLADGTKVSTLGQWLRRRPASGRVLVVVERGVRHQAVQAFAFGATDVIYRPIDREALLRRLLSTDESPTSVSSAISIDNQDAVLVGIETLQDAFKAVCAGASVDLRSIDAAGQVIVSHIKVEGLAYWIDAVRQYHSQTYQHCLLVTGVAVSFGQKLGFCEADQRKLAFSALLHDIGKAKIPIAILEKPSPLNRDEISTMKLHPLLGLEILQKMRELSPAVLDVVVHHHEYLDGSGYPHRLRSREIPDLVRITTIADLFGALIERRCYKPPLSSEAACEVLKGMGPKLDHDLVREFCNVVGKPSC